MHWRNRAFVLLALFYALLGGLIGIVWQAAPGGLPGNVPRLHGHVMLLGFVTMMIYGVGLHVLPRFFGRALYSERLATAQFYTANIGLWLLAAGWLGPWPAVAIAGGIVSFAAILMFAVNIVLTVRAYGPAA